jgi:hypothetical protein
MKTFKDLEFKPHAMGEGVHSKLSFDNGYGVSVVRTSWTYGGSDGLYELAVLDEHGQLTYNTSDWGTNDVIGYLSEEEVSDIMEQVQNL